MKIIRKNKSKGFTLIELIMVIAIISILASTTFVSFDNAQKKARDVRRVKNVFAIINAIRRYEAAFGELPGGGDGGGTHISRKCDSDLKSDLLDSGFMTPMVSDPFEDQTDCSDNSDDAYFYGWDSGHCCEGEWCVSINRLETQWAVDHLTEIFGDMHFTTGGGDANIGTGDDFNHCFITNSGYTCDMNVCTND